MKRWWCRQVGHRWAGQPALEHVCTYDWCWRCWQQRIVHLTGPWEHTCEQQG